MPGPPPFGSMPPPLPALTLVLTFMSTLHSALAVRIHVWATARFHFRFDLHVVSPIASINRCRPYAALNRFSHRSLFSLRSPFSISADQPFPSIPTPAPDFTLALTFMLLASFLLRTYPFGSM